MEAYLAEANRLREEVNAFIAAKRDGAAGVENPTPQSPKPKQRRLSPASYPTELAGWPLNPSPPAEVPNFHTMQTAQIVARARRRKVGAQLPSKPIGPTQLIKKGDLRTGRAAE
jgi:hypothetical protein